MDEFLSALQQNIDAVNEIGNKIERGEAYMDELKSSLPSFSRMASEIFGLLQNSEVALDLNPEFMMQVLNDMIYGIEQEDSVFLLDVLRYGLMEIYEYIAAKLQGGGRDEQVGL